MHLKTLATQGATHDEGISFALKISPRADFADFIN
jgi:hypothetical protein